MSKKLRHDLSPHQVSLAKEMEWERLKNGVLLNVAQAEFDVMLTMDANIYHQQNVALYDIAVIVLRAYDNDYESVLPLLPEVKDLLERVQSGEIYYTYIDEKLRESDRRKGKGPYAERG
ncbi:MAG: hypothetical protein ACREAB_04530 [Blastocatellia bacterium]